jgi:sterol-4alpha-carboxylate 3-dehydrogenase (decarboxylating)
VLAASRLLPGAATAGQRYFITDHEASNFYDFFTPFLQALDLPLPTRSIPYRVAYALGALAEWSARLPRANKGQPPLLTRYVVASTCVDFYFSHARATRDFGYLPPVSAEQARARTIEWLQAQQDLVATR